MQGSRQESGTTNALEIQQAQKRKYNENWKVRGDYSPMEEDFFQQNDFLCEMALHQFKYCLKIRKLKLRVTIYNLNQFFMNNFENADYSQHTWLAALDRYAGTAAVQIVLQVFDE